MSHPRVICIIGPDGVGKSTQAQRLVEVLQNQGVDCEYRWFGATHLVSLPLLAYARLVGLSEAEQLESGRQIGYHYFEQSRFVSALYPILLLIDTFIIYILKVFIPTTLLNKTLVCDRYVQDIVISLMISINNNKFYRSFVGQLFLQMVPKQSVVVVLLTDQEVLRSRRDDVREDKRLGQKIKLYQKMIRSQNLRVVGADKPPEQIHEELLSLVS